VTSGVEGRWLTGDLSADRIRLFVDDDRQVVDASAG
jgi:hypothetical protein